MTFSPTEKRWLIGGTLCMAVILTAWCLFRGFPLYTVPLLMAVTVVGHAPCVVARIGLPGHHWNRVAFCYGLYVVVILPDGARMDFAAPTPFMLASYFFSFALLMGANLTLVEALMARTWRGPIGGPSRRTK